MPALRHGFPEAAAHGLAQQNPGTNVADADEADGRRDRYVCAASIQGHQETSDLVVQLPKAQGCSALQIQVKSVEITYKIGIRNKLFDRIVCLTNHVLKVMFMCSKNNISVFSASVIDAISGEIF